MLVGSRTRFPPRNIIVQDSLPLLNRVSVDSLEWFEQFHDLFYLCVTICVEL